MNHTLQVLDISENPIGDEGIADIVKILNGSSICKLDVSKCNITDDGAKPLAASLKNNHTIELLSVQFNKITLDGVIAILEAGVSNGVCQEVTNDMEYECNDEVDKLMTILGDRKKQEVCMI